MRRFSAGGRQRHHGFSSAGSGSAARGIATALPVGFRAVGEALSAEECPLAACEAVGREMALDGASAQEALSGLEQAWRAVRGQDPDYAAVLALMNSWGEATLAAVSSVSCEDPMTGLASVAHLRSRVSAVFREHEQGYQEGRPRDTYAFVVVDLSAAVPEGEREGRGSRGGAAPVDPLGRALRMARLGEAVRTVFPGGEVVGRVGRNRVAVLTRRDDRLGVRVRLLRRLVEGMDLSEQRPRVWIEGLASSESACASLLDELSRA